MKKIVALLLIILMSWPVWGAYADSEPTVTVMVYFCASDLESEVGAATSDIAEMLEAELGDVNVVLQTGGTTQWQNDVMRSDATERYLLKDGDAVLLDTLPLLDMTAPETLTDFIDFAGANYPADRNILIFWDHGGGALYGYGVDENYPGHNMTLDEISQALLQSGSRFDLIGFDACLMGTVEVALTLSRYADYMIASQETEPGSGWYYTDWLTALSQNPGMETPELGRLIVDDFIDFCEANDLSSATLSVVDLAALRERAEEPLALFSEQTNDMILNGQYAMVSKARSGAKSFSYAEYDHVDLIDLAARTDADASDDLIDGLVNAVVYNRTTPDIQNANGLSAYFPYNEPNALSEMQAIYAGIDWPDAYETLVANFATMLFGGQALITAPETPFSQGGGWSFAGQAFESEAESAQVFGQLTGNSWFSQALLQSEAGYIEQNRLGEEPLTLTDKGDYYALCLSEADWAIINNVQSQVYVDDGQGYIDLGADDFYEYDEDGDLRVAFDYTWVALNGQVVPFYSGEYIEEADYFRYSGYVPMLLNGEPMDLMLAWDKAHEGGYVLGARPSYDAGNTATSFYRGLRTLKDGDVLQPLCDYYTYEEQLDDQYPLGDEIVVDGALRVSYEDIGESDARITFMLTDIYAKRYWTEPLTYTDE